MKYVLTIRYEDGREDYKPEVVGHYFPNDIPGYIVLVLENQDRLIVNLKGVNDIHIPKEVFAMAAQRHPSEADAT